MKHLALVAAVMAALSSAAEAQHPDHVAVHPALALWEGATPTPGSPSLGARTSGGTGGSTPATSSRRRSTTTSITTTTSCGSAPSAASAPSSGQPPGCRPPLSPRGPPATAEPRPRPLRCSRGAWWSPRPDERLRILTDNALMADDWPHGRQRARDRHRRPARGLARRPAHPDAARAPNGTLWFGGRARSRRRPRVVPARDGGRRRLVDTLIVRITPARQLEPGINRFEVLVSETGETWIERMRW